MGCEKGRADRGHKRGYSFHPVLLRCPHQPPCREEVKKPPGEATSRCSGQRLPWERAGGEQGLGQRVRRRGSDLPQACQGCSEVQGSLHCGHVESQKQPTRTRELRDSTPAGKHSSSLRPSSLESPFLLPGHRGVPLVNLCLYLEILSQTFHVHF